MTDLTIANFILNIISTGLLFIWVVIGIIVVILLNKD